MQADFDGESDTLYLYSAKEKAAGSLGFGNLVIDYAKDGSIVGLEFLDASATLPPLFVVAPKNIFESEKRLKPAFLAQISGAAVSVDTAANFMVIKCLLEYNKQELDCRLTLPVSGPKDLAIAAKIAKK
ncbi:MAG: DUF2283 domain-containing protein [Candidatus Micrarchaeota archaeon]